MEAANQTMLLREANIEPTKKVLENVLGKKLLDVYIELLNLTTNELGIEYEWRYYKDGKAWLFKAVYKKKTIFWLSVWDGFIKTSFFFTEKTRQGIFDLTISDEIKKGFSKAKPTGKLIALILDIDNIEQLNNFREIASYKKSLK